jgi:hypothetical protein
LSQLREKFNDNITDIGNISIESFHLVMARFEVIFEF